MAKGPCTLSPKVSYVVFLFLFYQNATDAKMLKMKPDLISCYDG